MEYGEAHRARPLEFGLEKGQAEYDFDFPLGEEALLWSEYDPALYRLEVELPGYDRLSVDFGLRDFRAEGKHFAINGMTTFLRGKHDACVFPLTGHTAMDMETWRHYFPGGQILRHQPLSFSFLVSARSLL